MVGNAATNVGFSDESNWNKGRFRSLGLVTAPMGVADALSQGLRQLLDSSGVREFAWKRLDGAKERFAAEKMVKYAVSHAHAGRLRADVLVWDISDSRHTVAGRDDEENLGRMYYHLFRNVLRARWPSDSVWRLHPDEHSGMDWGTVQDCLESVAVRTEIERSLFTGGEFRLILRREFGVEEVRCVPSGEHPLLQLADLLAGLAVFSREKYDVYERWRSRNSAQASLFDEEDDIDTLSRSSRERLPVLKTLDDSCKKEKLGVSLKRSRGLWTPDPRRPLNFWLYEPQQSQDKAPTRRFDR